MKIRFFVAGAAALLATSAIAQPHLDASKPFDFTDKDRWLIRARGIYIEPDVDSNTSIGGDVDVDFQATPEVDITYFFTDHIAAELIAAVAKHDVSAANTSLGNLDLGDVTVIPPTLTLQYHFNPHGQFRPYAGAGINYTIYTDENPGQVNDVDIDNDFGFAVQAGMDIGIDEHWAINADVKKLYVDADASINGGAVSADIDLDPWIFGLGVAYRF